MPLTPQDVREKLFTSTRFAKGYDEDEVDAFLDEVEAELVRLLAENEELRGQLAAASARAASLGPAAEGGSAPGEMEEMLRRTLLLAQRTADEAVSEARAEAARILDQAREEATRVEQEATRRQAALVAELEERRRRLQAEVDGLRGFEQELRSRLRSYLQMQLRDLESLSPDQPGAGRQVPGPASAAPTPDSPAAPSSAVGRQVEPPPPVAPGGRPAGVLPEFPSLVAPSPDPGELDE